MEIMDEDEYVERIDGQKGDDGGSNWRAGTRDTEIRLDG